MQDDGRSGFEDLWETVYAQNSLPKMFEGKAYTKNVHIRAFFLIYVALHLTLLESSQDSKDNMTDEAA